MSCSVLSTTLSLMQMFNDKMDEFVDDIKNDHMVWLQEIQEEATSMFSSEFSAEPELMPKTPSQKKSNRRKRVSVGGNASRVKRRFSKGKRSNLRRFSVTTSLNLIAEDAPGSPASEVFTEEPKRSTRRNKQSLAKEDAEQPKRSIREAPQNSLSDGEEPESAPSTSRHHSPPQIQMLGTSVKISASERESAEMQTPPPASSISHSPPPIPMLEAVVRISSGDRNSAEMHLSRSPPQPPSPSPLPPPDKLMKPVPSPGRSVTKIAIAGSRSSRRSSVRHSLTARRSLVGLRHSMTQKAVSRASRRSSLKKALLTSLSSSSNASEVMVVSDEEVVVEEESEGLSEQPAGAEVQADMVTEAPPEEKGPAPRLTRSRAQNTPVMAAPASIINKSDGSGKKLQSNSTSSLRTRPMTKRKAADATEDFPSPRKMASPPKISQTAIKPAAMRSFLQTVQKNQLLMMTPSTTGRASVMKSFIKHNTPLRVDIKERERLKLEALKKKQEQEEERKRKLQEEKRRKQEELKRKREEKLRKVAESRIKEEQRVAEEKKKKIEQKMAQMDENNDKLRVERLAEDKAKKVAATKRQEELEQRRKLEEEARRKKILQAEEEKRLQEEQQAKKKQEEEQDRARRQAEARRALELKKEQERERERERQAAAEREREEREKALALQREAEKALREKERRELDEWRKREEEQQKRAEEERAARLREAARQEAARQKEAAQQKEAARQKEAAQQKEAARQKEAEAARQKGTPAINITVDIENSLMKTPVGKGPVLNATMDIEQSPQSYDLTPKGGNKPVVVNANPEDYGMDQNSDDSTDDEQAPRKPIPSWAGGVNLKHAIMQQYYNPQDLHAHFGECEAPKLENIFFKSKPRYFKRTSSAVWHSPPLKGTLPF